MEPISIQYEPDSINLKFKYEALASMRGRNMNALFISNFLINRYLLVIRQNKKTHFFRVFEISLKVSECACCQTSPIVSFTCF